MRASPCALCSLYAAPLMGPLVLLFLSLQMAEAEQTDSLLRAFFGTKPRFLVYCLVDDVKHYLVFAKMSTYSAKAPKLWIVRPAEGAPAAMPALCVVARNSERALLDLIQRIPHYSALEPGRARPSSVSIHKSLQTLACRVCSKRPVKFPVSWDDEQVLQFFHATITLPDIFQVEHGLQRARYTHQNRRLSVPYDL